MPPWTQTSPIGEARVASVEPNLRLRRFLDAERVTLVDVGRVTAGAGAQDSASVVFPCPLGP